MEMTDDTLVPPYPLKPGQNVTIVSKYSADEKHSGEQQSLHRTGERFKKFVACSLSATCTILYLAHSILRCSIGGTWTIMPAMRSGASCAGVMALWILTVTNWDPTCPGGEI